MIDPPFKINITSIDDAIQILDGRHAFTHVVSITNEPAGFDDQTGYRTQLFQLRGLLARSTAAVTALEFDDIAVPRVGYRPPERRHVDLLVGLGRRLPATADLLVHCTVGISRSTAAALVMLVAAGHDHDAAWQYVRAIQPSADPNTLVLRHAEAALGLADGTLLRAVRWGRQRGYSHV